MPNWCEGNLKIRGKAGDVEKFLDETIYQGGKVLLDNGMIELKGIDGHLKDTYRCFINADKNGFYDEFWVRNDGSVVVVIPVKHAWTPCLQYFEELSKKYNVDFKFYGYEMGLEFNCEFEIISGNITINREIKFNDYLWECPEPRIGG
ncbi:hypothetical protein MB831_04725 [Pasteurella multocida subsp. multocida]|uniref:DUF1281 family ferredoxin-like fold protein n=1 Tax=Pasteurella multocida TaxID=747 RepID=UPI002236ABF0|nr:hypothetical protein [Pasteurella multocida]MCW4596778.1 hypothetical protein [Pasteurella multocida subsp. multocida]